MDGGPIGPAPHRVCDIVETFTLDNIEFRPGMQGEILEKATDEGGVQWARIFIEGVTETGTKPDDCKKGYLSTRSRSARTGEVMMMAGVLTGMTLSVPHRQVTRRRSPNLRRRRSTRHHDLNASPKGRLRRG
jgi:hypothetical protein